jgi:glycosyltransferase involved in cell wall biosynthesis
LSTSPGVNLVGFFHAEFGQGEVARRLDRALRQAGIPHTTVPFEDVPHRQEQPFEHSDVGPHDVNVLCLNAEHLVKHAEGGLTELLADRLSAGVWFWETSLFPAYLRPALKFVDEVWVASDFVADAIRAATSVPVFTFPLPVEVPPETTLTRAELGLPDDRFLFSFVFDFYSTAVRKNPDGLIEAYAKAFGPDDGGFLLVKSINGERFPDELRSLEAKAVGRPDIRIVDGFAPSDHLRAYTALADCSVSLHRSEGFGLTLAEAMALGKPAIATGYSGNLTFMDEANAYLVRHGLTELEQDVGPYPAGSVWAEPDLDHAAELMRRAVAQSDEARERSERGRRTILENHSLERTAAFLAERIPHLHRRRQELRLRGTPSERAAAFLVRGPRTPWSQPSRLGRVGLLYRRLLLRLLRPYTARQRELEHTLVDGLRELELENEQLRRRLAELERQRGGT